jgi:hypothetical protein
MKNIGIAIDEWKLTIFTRRLTEAGFSFGQTKGVSPNTLFLSVIVEEEKINKLAIVIQCANNEAHRSKMN